MSRTVRGNKHPGYEYWGKRPMKGAPPGRFAKTQTHRIERRKNKEACKEVE